jgi:hypothetical protein
MTVFVKTLRFLSYFPFHLAPLLFPMRSKGTTSPVCSSQPLGPAILMDSQHEFDNKCRQAFQEFRSAYPFPPLDYSSVSSNVIIPRWIYMEFETNQTPLSSPRVVYVPPIAYSSLARMLTLFRSSYQYLSRCGGDGAPEIYSIWKCNKKAFDIILECDLYDALSAVRHTTIQDRILSIKSSSVVEEEKVKKNNGSDPLNVVDWLGWTVLPGFNPIHSFLNTCQSSPEPLLQRCQFFVSDLPPAPTQKSVWIGVSMIDDEDDSETPPGLDRSKSIDLLCHQLRQLGGGLVIRYTRYLHD